MNKKRKILSWILVIIWMALIFIVSHQPATESEELSLGVTDIIAGFINRIVPNITIDTYILEHFIRKCAHFIEYMVLGVLVANGLLNHNKHKLKLVIPAFLICVLYAISDEVHQLFIPGRSGQFTDVLIDCFGGLVGVLLMSALSGRVRNLNKLG